jgi:hypothetical protein
MFGVFVCEVASGIKSDGPWCKDDGAHMENETLFLLFKVNRIFGTEFFTGPALPFVKEDTILLVNGVLKRDRLCVFHINRLSRPQIFIKGIMDFFRAFLSTNSTPNTFFRIHISGVSEDFYFKIASLPLDAGDFRKGQKFNVKMPVDLNQFGSQDSDGTIVCGKRLVQLGHYPTYGRALFQEVDRISRIGQIEG